MTRPPKRSRRNTPGGANERLRKGAADPAQMQRSADDQTGFLRTCGATVTVFESNPPVSAQMRRSSEEESAYTHI